jgi:DNA repair exonuclease SbcCD nuclease subunit
VILAGDIDTGARAIAWADQEFRWIPTVYVHGNHEGYGHNLDDVQNELRAAAGATENVHYLNCGEFQTGGVRFLLAALWTDFCLFGDEHRRDAMAAAEQSMNDYRRIRLASFGYRKLRASDTERWHHEQRIWLESKLDEPFAGKTVVVTHMAPSGLSVPDEYTSDIISSAFASNLDPGLVEKADLWVHGHTHNSSDYQIGKCRVVSNPCGYQMSAGTPENREFNPGFIVEV